MLNIYWRVDTPDVTANEGIWKQLSYIYLSDHVLQ